MQEAEGKWKEQRGRYESFLAGPEWVAFDGAKRREFEFRFNVRMDEDRFTTTLRCMAGVAPVPHIELIAVPKTES